jgi:hypothetical protein
LRIARFPSLNEVQFFGCVAAFADSLSGELNSATAALRRLESQGKGDAFAYEMALDKHRYGASIVLDRWGSFVDLFGPHLPFPRARGLLDTTPGRIRAAESVLTATNRLIDAAADYNPALVEAASLAFQTVQGIFGGERAAAEQDGSLGPMLPEDYVSARRIFLEDLAQR